MQPFSRGSGTPHTTALVSAVALVMLAVMAFSMPPARIEVRDKSTRRGYLVSHAWLSPGLAEQLAHEGYNLLAIDLTDASLDPGALWRRYLDDVARRQFRVWGWVDGDRIDKRKLERIAAAVNVTGLFVYGSNAESVAAWIRSKFSRLPEGDVVAVTRALTAPEFAAADEGGFRVLRAESLARAEIAAARGAVQGDYLVARLLLR